jgi:hypothetical protein
VAVKGSLGKDCPGVGSRVRIKGGVSVGVTAGKVLIPLNGDFTWLATIPEANIRLNKVINPKINL